MRWNRTSGSTLREWGLFVRKRLWRLRTTTAALVDILMKPDAQDFMLGKTSVAEMEANAMLPLFVPSGADTLSAHQHR